MDGRLSNRQIHPGRSKSKKKDATRDFVVVGIGASAGGLEAFSKLLEELKGNNGLVLVFIQHLIHSHKNILDVLLKNKTSLHVTTITNNMHLEGNSIYIIPPNKYVEIEDGKFRLSSRNQQEAKFHPIDYFFISLAEAFKDRAVGVILSGLGNDGTLGLKTIKENGGITFSQNGSAQHPEMPQSAVDSGFVDHTLSPTDIARQLSRIANRPYVVESLEKILSGSNNELQKIMRVVHSKRGVNFFDYKKGALAGSVIRRIFINKLENTSEYYNFLNKHPAEVDTLFDDLLNHITYFFRDKSFYKLLSEEVLPEILKNRKSGNPIRIWIPGCATGEEAYSIAMVLFDYLGSHNASYPTQIFATDISENLIVRARTGLYSESDIETVSKQRIEKYFVKDNTLYQINKNLRNSCIFSVHNLLNDPPFSYLDLIICRNVLNYLEPLAQKTALQAFYYGIKAEGFLLVDKSDTVGEAGELFSPFITGGGIYIKMPRSSIARFNFFSELSAFDLLSGPLTPKKVPVKNNEVTLDRETDELLLSRFVPASVMVDKNLQIITFRGTTSTFLQPAAGKASLHLMKMVKPELVNSLKMLLLKAKKENRPKAKSGMYSLSNGVKKQLTLEVVPMKLNEGEQFYLIVFNEGQETLKSRESTTSAGNKTKKDTHIYQLENELGELRDQLRLINEEYESTGEELRASNEELHSANEELQSINEELETSKEELQATNEEINTINDELAARNVELSESYHYSSVIVNAVSESLVLLTSDFRIKIANDTFFRTFHLTKEECEGKIFFEIGERQWDIPLLRTVITKIFMKQDHLRNLEISREFSLAGKKILLLNIYKIPRKQISESMVLIAIEDITGHREAEEKIRASEEKFRLLIQNSSDIISILTEEGNAVYESPSLKNVLGYDPDERIGKNIFDAPIVHPDDMAKKQEMIRRSVEHPDEIIKAEFRLRHKNGSWRNIEAISQNLLNDPLIHGIVTSYRDVTERKILEQHKDEFIGIASHELRTPVTSVKAYAEILQDKFERSGDTISAQLAEKMDVQLDKLIRLIDDLLNVTKIEEGTLRLRQNSFDINQLIQEITEEMNRTARHNIRKEVGESLVVKGDRERTGQVLRNLIGNAIKYSPKGTDIIIRSSTEATHAKVCVQDFGLGIAKKMQSKIFDRYFRVSEPTLENFPGLGLGLYVVAEIVKKQGGTIQVHSKRGQGSTFCFTVPTD